MSPTSHAARPRACSRASSGVLWLVPALGACGDGYLGFRAGPQLVDASDASTVERDAASTAGDLDAGAGPDDEMDRCDQAIEPTCRLGPATVLPEEVMASSMPQAFAGGRSLPAGRYRATYAGGCAWFAAAWSVHLTASSGFEVAAWLVANGQRRFLLPGYAIASEQTSGLTPAGFFSTYEECVAANCRLAALEFEFEGGSLGIVHQGLLSSFLDAGVPSSRDPSYRLALLDPCP